MRERAGGSQTAPARLHERRAGPLHVAVGGDPDTLPIVLLHGLGGSFHSLGRLPALLARRRRVVAVDLPGFGRSPSLPGGGFLLDDVGRVLAAALDELGVDEHALCGHSMGGGVAIAYAAERPHRVGALALLAPAGIVATGAVRASWGRPLVHRVGREATRFAEPLLLAPRIRRAAFARLVGDPAALSTGDALGLVRASRRGRATGPAGITIVNAGLRDRLHRLTMPTLVVWGDQDRVIPADGADALAAALPDGRLLRLPNTGHLPAIERPDEVAAGIEALVDGIE